MPERKPSAIIGDMLKCIRHIREYSGAISFNEFAGNFMIVEACLYNIQVIGEAISKIPGDVKENNPKIPWKLINGMRNRLIHDYIGTDLSLVWNVIKNDLPDLETDLESIYNSLLEKHK